VTQPTLALVSPKFHGYWLSLARACERRGLTVHPHIYDDHRLPRRVLRKLTHDTAAKAGLSRPFDRLQTRIAISALRRIRPDVVVIIKGDTLGPEFWEEVTSYRHRALWLYDELRRTQHTAESLAAASAVASYSLSDVATLKSSGINAIHLPLAFDLSTTFTPIKTGGVTFIGARYPKREQLLLDLNARGVEIRAYGRDWSDNVIDRVRTLRVKTVGVPNGRDLDRVHAYGVMAGAIATLNIHGDQDGFTMRTFEAAGVGAVQLIDRPDVRELYEPDTEIAVFNSTEEAIELARRALRDRAWAERIRAGGRKRTLAEHTFDHRVAELEKLWQ